MGAGLRFGQRVVMVPRFEPASFLEAIQTHRCSVAPLVPPIIAFLAKHPLVGKCDLSSLRAIMNGAAPLDAETQDACERTLGNGMRVRQGYGLTETSPVTNLAPYGFASAAADVTDYGAVPARAGSIGGPLAGTEMRVVDVSTPEALAAAGTASPRLLPPGEANVGEVQIKGPQVFLGYHQNEKATAESLLPGGWFRTGDLGFADECGHFSIVDRLKELIKVKGMQVAPAELEGALLSHPLVYDAAVVGRPDARAGEMPVAFVVTRLSFFKTGEPVSAAQLRAHLAGRLADFKLPAEADIRFIDAVPKSGSGKILRRVLKDRLAGGAAS